MQVDGDGGDVADTCAGTSGSHLPLPLAHSTAAVRGLPGQRAEVKASSQLLPVSHGQSS